MSEALKIAKMLIKKPRMRMTDSIGKRLIKDYEALEKENAELRNNTLKSIATTVKDIEATAIANYVYENYSKIKAEGIREMLLRFEQSGENIDGFHEWVLDDLEKSDGR